MRNDAFNKNGSAGLEHILSSDMPSPDDGKRKKELIAIVVFVVVLVAGGIGFFAYNAGKERSALREEIARVQVNFDNGDFDGVESAAGKILASDPGNVDALLALAAAYAQRGSIEFREEEWGKRAIEAAQRALAIDPENAEAHRIIGYAYEIMEVFDDAIAHYDEAIALNGRFALAISQKGHVYDLLGDTGAAERLYIEALSIDPELDHALLNMARVHVRRGEYEDANSALDNLLAVTANKRFRSDGFQLKGFIALSGGEFDNALRFFEESLATDEKNVAALSGLAETKYYLLADATEEDFGKRIEEIFSILQKANEISPEFTSAYVIAARTLLLLGDNDGAREFLSRAAEVVRTDITLMADEKEDMSARIKDMLDSIES